LGAGVAYAAAVLGVAGVAGFVEAFAGFSALLVAAVFFAEAALLVAAVTLVNGAVFFVILVAMTAPNRCGRV
jgi:hypothetical protein